MMDKCTACNSRHICTTSNQSIKGEEITYQYCGTCGNEFLDKGITMRMSKGQEMLKSGLKRDLIQINCWGMTEATFSKLTALKNDKRLLNLTLKGYLKLSKKGAFNDGEIHL